MSAVPCLRHSVTAGVTENNVETEFGKPECHMIQEEVLHRALNASQVGMAARVLAETAGLRAWPKPQCSHFSCGVLATWAGFASAVYLVPLTFDRKSNQPSAVVFKIITGVSCFCLSRGVSSNTVWFYSYSSSINSLVTFVHVRSRGQVLQLTSDTVEHARSALRAGLRHSRCCVSTHIKG
jgi:hypothetical protein